MAARFVPDNGAAGGAPRLRFPPSAGETRTPAELAEAYEVEVALADQLRSAARERRAALYAEVYNELLQRLPQHPQLARKQTAEQRAAAARRQLRFLEQFLQPEDALLEIGAGDCALSLEAAKRVRRVYALEVNDEIVRRLPSPPENFKLVLSKDGASIPLPPESVDVAYSNQLMEHLHPDDAIEQLRNIFQALKPNGVYVCMTPNRLSGPHDISRYFDATPRGLHLREYSTLELNKLFRENGFRTTTVYIGGRGKYIRAPGRALAPVEGTLELLPHRLRRSLTQGLLGGLLGVRIAARK